MKFVLSILQRGEDARNTVRPVGEYDRLENAIAAAKLEVDAVLKRIHDQGMTPVELVEKYRACAEVPCLTRDDEETMNANSFNHFQYAKTRSEEICAEGH